MNDTSQIITVDIEVAGEQYQLACNDGEEEHLLKLVAEYNRRIDGISRKAFGIGETTRMLMAGIMLADEVGDLRKELHDMKKKITNLEAEYEQKKVEEVEAVLAETIDAIVSRLDNISETIEER